MNLQKKINDMVIELIVDFISLIDKAYKESEERKKEFYINKSNVPRTLFTIYGEITFEKTLYRSKKDNKRYYCFVKAILKINKTKI